MSVKIADNFNYDLSKSLLKEDGSQFNTKPISITGAVALDDEMRVQPLITGFLNRQISDSDISFETAKTYGKNLNYLVSYLKSQKSFQFDPLDDCLLHVQTSSIQQYLNYLKRDKALSSVTVRNRDATYLSFYTNYLCNTINSKDAVRQDNPYENGLLSNAPNSQLIEMCELDELHGLMRCTQSERERAVLQFMFDSGLRRSEIPRVTKSHIDNALASNRNNFIVDEFTVSIPSKYKMLNVPGSKGKNREYKPRATLVSEPTLLRVRRYNSSPLYRKYASKHSEKPAFLNAHGNPFTKGAISDLLKRLSKRALKRGFIKRSISPHMLRHGFAGHILRSPDLGKDALDRLITCQHCLGHSSLETTQTYTRIPYEIYGQIIDQNGEIFTRDQLMESLGSKTKILISIDTKK